MMEKMQEIQLLEIRWDAQKSLPKEDFFMSCNDPCWDIKWILLWKVEIKHAVHCASFS